MMNTTHSRRTDERTRGYGTLKVVAVLGACVGLGGCMKMRTQQATLEHKPSVIAPEDTGGTSTIVTVPTESRDQEPGR